MVHNRLLYRVEFFPVQSHMILLQKFSFNILHNFSTSVSQNLTSEVEDNSATKNPAKIESEGNLSPRLSTRETESEIDPNLLLPMRVETPEEAAARIARQELEAAILIIQTHDRARKDRIIGAECKI